MVRKKNTTLKPKTVISNADDQSTDDLIISPKPIRWYEKAARSLHLSNDALIYLGVFLFLVIGYFITRATLHWQGGPIKAGSNTVKISIQPAAAEMPPNTTFQLWETADNPVLVTTARIIFDPTRVKMIGEVSTSPSPLTRVIQQTAMSEANTTGVINLTLAKDPVIKTNPPIGSFELATIPMSVNTAQSLSTTLHLDTGALQVVNPDSSLFTITAVDALVSLNPPATPTPTPKPTATPTPTARATATPTPLPTPTVTPASNSASGNLLQDPSFESTGNWPSPWWFETDYGAAGTISRDTTTAADGVASARIHVTTPSSTSWHVQFMNGLSISKGRTYTVTFWAKADSNRTIKLEIDHKTSPYTNYFKASASLTTSWQKFTYSFTSNSTDASTLILFYFANNTGNVWLDGVSVQ